MINKLSPLISILSHIFETNTVPPEVHFLYTSRVKGYYNISHILGLERLLSISKANEGKFYLYLFFGGYASRTMMEAAVPRQRFEPRVMMGADILDIFRNFKSKHTTVCYVAGPPNMTSHFVKLLQQKVGMEASRVLYEEYESEVSQVYTENRLLWN
jgi:NAD(P)H-flavin reductase